MEELKGKEKEAFDELMKSIGQALIGTMRIADIPNYIEATFDCDGEYYKFRIDRISDNNNELTKI